MNILLISCPPPVAARIPILLAAAERGRYRCESADGLEQGLRRLSKNDIDLVLWNLAPPQRGGLEEFLKARTQMLDRPIVVIAQPEYEILAIEAVQRGAQDYVLASSLLDAKQLTHTIRSAIDGYRLSGQTEHLTRELQASEANFYQMIHSNADGMVIIDRAGLICFVNPAAETLLGRSAKDLLGSRFEFPVMPGKTEEFEILVGGKKVRTAEMRIVETLWEAQPAYLASLRDISERKRLEALKDEFVSKVSHELRTPMTSIKGAVTLMLERAMGEINPEQEDFLHTISQDIDRLADLINNVLDLSKMEAGKMTVNRQRLEAAAIIDQACRSYQTILGSRRIVRQFDPVPPVYVDHNLILQVIANLLGNAIKFTKNDGTITFSLRADDGFVAVRISDDGPGMPKEALGKLFQKFVQAEGSPAADHPKGTGLGLAICREIVQLHKGRIWVESELGQGSTFAFTVPIYEPARTFNAMVQEMKESAAAEQTDFSLLVIDIQGVQAAGGSAPAELMTTLEDTVRKSVARNDHVIPFEPQALAVLAAADTAGASAMRARLAGRCIQWVVAAGAAGSFGVGTATFPQDGDTATALVQRAKARASDDRRSRQETRAGTERSA